MQKLVVLVAVFVILLFLIIVVKSKRETTQTEVATVTPTEATFTTLETSEPETSETYNSESGTSEPDNSQTYNSESGTSEPDNSQTYNSESGTPEPDNSQTYNSEPGTSEPDNSQTYNSEPGTSEPGNSQTYNSESGTSEPDNSQTYNSESGTSESLTFLKKIDNWSIWSATSQGAPYIIAKPDYTLTYLVTARGNFTRYDIATVGIIMYHMYLRPLVERQLLVGMVDEMWPSTDSGEVPCRIDYFNGYNKVVKTITTVGTYNANTNTIFISLDEVLAPMRGFDPQTLDIGTVDIIFYTNFGLAHVYVDVLYIFDVLTAMNDWFDKL
jgi:hypothetical protein